MTAPRFGYAALLPHDDSRVRALWGRPPINLYRILAHHPRILRAWTEWNNELRHGCTLPRALRELIFLRSAHLQMSHYEWTQHLPMARNAGLEESKITAIVNWGPSTAYDERERILLQATDEIAGGALTDLAFAGLRHVFSEGEAIEVIVTASHAAMLGRIIQAIAVTDAGEQGAQATH